MTAYDYDAQVWRDGVAGARLLLGQLSAEFALLSGEGCADYLKFIGKPMTEGQIQTTLETIQRGIAACEAEIEDRAALCERR